MKNDWVAILMRYYRITFLFVLLALVLGFYGFKKMAKAEYPEMVMRTGLVVAVYPGASAEDVEEQVARPLERYLFTFDEVKRHKTTTTSSNGMCVMQVELQDDINNKDEVWSKIKHGLNAFKAQSLPAGVLALVVNDDFGSASALLIAIESENRSYRNLKDYSDDLADALRRIPSVSNVKLYGESKEQLTIYIDEQRLSAYGIGRASLIQALHTAGFTTLTGSVSGLNKDVPIHVEPALNNEEEIENKIIYTDGGNHVVRVKDVARVVREYDNTKSYIEYNGHPCVLLSLEMIDGNNIVEYGHEVQKVLDDFSHNRLPKDVTVSRIADQCKVVEYSVSDFMVNLVESMIIIVVVMLILFPWRTAVVAGVMVPLSTFISIGIMYLAGIPLNTCTLAGLIVVLGMVVDNAIVVLDGYLEYINKGMSRWHAAAYSAQKYFMPMLLSTVCISVIFFPFLLTLTGNFLDFIRWLPWTIFINLMVSLVLAVVVIPILEVWLIKREDPSSPKAKKKTITDYVQQCYGHILNFTFRFPWITIGTAIALVVLSVLFIVPQLKVRMMPMADRNQFAVEISLPDGSGLSQTRAIADSVCQALHKDKDVVSITSFIGCSSPRFHTAYAPKIAGRNYAQLIVNTTSSEATVRLLDKYEPLYSERYPNAFVKFKQLDFQSYPSFEARFYGDDIDSLRQVADTMMARMRQMPELMNVHTDWDEPRPIIDVTLDPIRASQMGINRTEAELMLYLSTGSTQIGSIWEGDYEVPLVLKDINNDDLDCNSINDLYITSRIPRANVTQDGVYVSEATGVNLRQIGEAKPAWMATNIVHRGGERCITVTADLKRNYLAQYIHPRIQQIAEHEIHLPHGVRFEAGGEPENNTETMGHITAGFIIAIVIVFIFLLFNFRGYKITIISMVSLLLMLPAALLGLWIMNRAVGLTAIFGFITLMGMIMKNEILIFEHADDKRHHGFSIRDAAYDAGRRRMVPIFLTTATTAVGVVPMIIAATSFWMPVGVTIFAGGIGALIMVVMVLPVTYWKLYEPFGPKNKKKK